MVVAEQDGVVVGFVDSEPGELTRLFIVPSAVGQGLGKRLLEIGIQQARVGYQGAIRVEATLNAISFLRTPRVQGGRERDCCPHGWRTTNPGGLHGIVIV
jgi:GNAT superfamily N-acetyltransferase